jgi:hypothetical protein
MPPAVADCAIRCADALIGGVAEVNRGDALSFIAEAIELKPKHKFKHVTCFDDAEANALDQVLAGRAELRDPQKKIAHEKGVSVSRVSRAKVKFRKSSTSGKS